MLGFDFGRRRIGVAVGEQLTGIATALTTLNSRNGEPDWQAIAHLVEEWQPREMVVGIANHADGSTSDIARESERFARVLEESYGLPVHRIDERLSSWEAGQLLEAARPPGKRGRRDKAEMDQRAAQLILQSWLNRQGNNRG